MGKAAQTGPIPASKKVAAAIVRSHAAMSASWAVQPGRSVSPGVAFDTAERDSRWTKKSPHCAGLFISKGRCLPWKCRWVSKPQELVAFLAGSYCGAFATPTRIAPNSHEGADIIPDARSARSMSEPGQLFPQRSGFVERVRSCFRLRERRVTL